MSQMDQYLTEAQYQQKVTDYCDLLRLKWHHEVDSIRGIMHEC